MLDDVLYVLKQKVMALLKKKMRNISWFMATSPGYPADFGLSKQVERDDSEWISHDFSAKACFQISGFRLLWEIDVNCTFIQSGKL
jgi:hypothetical protein